MLKGLLIIILLVCIGLIIYTVANAVITIKKNNAADETSAKIFMASIEKELEEKTERVVKPDPIPTFTQEQKKSIKEKKELDYDTYDEEEISVEAQGKRLKDFFGE